MRFKLRDKGYFGIWFNPTQTGNNESSLKYTLILISHPLTPVTISTGLDSLEFHV